ncbi:hypothetical protein PHMEG_00026554, partial [Phytophthora megakarya]
HHDSSSARVECRGAIRYGGGLRLSNTNAALNTVGLSRPVAPPKVHMDVQSLNTELQTDLSEFVRRSIIKLPQFVELMRGQANDGSRPNKRMILEGYGDVDTFVEIAKFGARAPLVRQPAQRRPYPKKHKSADERYSCKEYPQGAGQMRCLMLDLDILDSRPEIHISLSGDVDLLTTGRVIRDLAFPDGSSLNDLANTKRICTSKFHATETLQQQEQYPDAEILLHAGNLNAVILKHEYVPLLGHLVRDNALVIDTAAAFGWSGSPAYYGVIGDAIAFLTNEERLLIEATSLNPLTGFDINYRELLSCSCVVHTWGPADAMIAALGTPHLMRIFGSTIFLLYCGRVSCSREISRLKQTSGYLVTGRSTFGFDFQQRILVTGHPHVRRREAGEDRVYHYRARSVATLTFGKYKGALRAWHSWTHDARSTVRCRHAQRMCIYNTSPISFSMVAQYGFGSNCPVRGTTIAIHFTAFLNSFKSPNSGFLATIHNFASLWTKLYGPKEEEQTLDDIVLRGSLWIPNSLAHNALSVHIRLKGSWNIDISDVEFSGHSYLGPAFHAISLLKAQHELSPEIIAVLTPCVLVDRAGVDEVMIQFHGRWASDTFKEYIRLCKESIEIFATKIG